MFVRADIKWGDPVLGTSGGIVQWNADLSEGLVFDENLYEADEFDDALRSAFEAWEDVADINFVESLNDSEISVEMAPLNGDTIGLAELTFVRTDDISTYIDADLTFDSNEEWSPMGESGLSFYAVALHEIGHALGLLHVPDETQIMHEFLTASDLGEGDIDGAQELYGEAPIPLFEATETTNLSFIEQFLNIILGIFGLSIGSSTAAAQPLVWADSDSIDLSDVIPITDLLDENGMPYEVITVVHAVPSPDVDSDTVHYPGCSCGCACGTGLEFAEV